MLSLLCFGAIYPIQAETANVRAFGAKGDGVSDDSRAFRAAIASGKAEILVPKGDYVLGSSVSIRASNVTLRFQDGATILGSTSGVTLLDIRGAEPSVRVALPANARKGQRTLQLPSGITAKPGSWLELRSEAPLPDVPNTNRKKCQQLVRVMAVTNGKATLDVPLTYDFATSQQATVGEARVLEDVKVQGLRAKGPFFRAIRWAYASGTLTDTDISGNRVSETRDRQAACAIVLTDAVKVDISKISCRDIDWYGVGIDGSSRDIQIREGHFINNRHAVSLNWFGEYGEPVGIKVIDSEADQSRLSGFDTHDVGRDILFLRCISRGAGDCGFQARTSYVTFDHCKAFGAKLDGIFARPVDNGNPPSHIQVLDSETSENGRFGIRLPGEDNTVRSVICRENRRGTTGGGILIGGGTLEDAEVTDSGIAVTHGDPSVRKAWDVVIRNLRAPKSARQNIEVAPSKLAKLRRG